MTKHSKKIVIFLITALVLVFFIEFSPAAAPKTFRAKTKSVWIIPDIHCDESSQLAISHMLQKLAEKYTPREPLLILMEGADGIVATSFFQSFPRPEIRHSQTLSLLKKGVISGPEYLKIKEGSNFPIILEGIENENLYTRNFKQLRGIVQKRRFLNPWFHAFEKKISKLKKIIYSQKMQKLEKLSLQFENSEINISDYLRELNAISLQIPALPDFPKPQISLFSQLQTKEKLFSNPRLNQEIQHLLITFSKTGQQEKLKMTYRKLVLYKLGKTSNQNYSRQLHKIFDQLPREEKSNYPMIREFLNIIDLEKRLDIEALQKETQSYSEFLVKNLISSDSERELHDLARNFKLLNKVTALEASRVEFEAVRAKPENFSPDKLLPRLNVLLMKSRGQEEFKYRAKPSVFPHLKRLFRNSMAFYETALNREMSFAQNIVRHLNQYQTDFAVIIAGGFHGSGLREILKTYSIRSKIVIPPFSSAGGENHYFDLMMNAKLGRSMLSIPRLFSRLMARIGPDFQAGVLNELLVSFIDALQKEMSDAEALKIVQQWLLNFDGDLPEGFTGKSDLLINQLSALSEGIAGVSGSYSSRSQIILDVIQSHLRIWIQVRRDWAEIAKREDLSPEPPDWFKYFAADAEAYSVILSFAGRYAQYKEAVRIPNGLNKDPLFILSNELQEDRPLFMRMLHMASHKKFEAYYVIEQLPFFVSVLGGHPDNYRLLIELAEKIYTGYFVSSFSFQQMIAKPYFKKEDIQLAIELADKGLDPASLFATIDEKFRVKRPVSDEAITALKDEYLDMLHRIHDNTGSIEENQLILESTLLSLFLADPAGVAKAFKLEGSQLELWQNLGILFPYGDIPENHSFLDFLKYIPVSHMKRIFTIVLAPKLSASSNYSGVVYLPMNISQMEEEGKAVDFEDLTNEIAQSLFEGMDEIRLRLWHDIQKMRDFVASPNTADPEQVEYTSFRDFSEMYKQWFSDPDTLMLRANQDTIFRVHLEMMAEYFILEDGESNKYLRFYVPQYDTDDDGETMLLKQSMGIKIPYLGLTPVDIEIKHDSGPLWPVILGAYRELMDDALDEELEAAYQNFLAHGPMGDKNFSYFPLNEVSETHQEINRAIDEGQAIAFTASSLDQMPETSDSDELARFLTKDMHGITPSAQLKLSDFLSSEPHQTSIMRAMRILKKILQTDDMRLQNRRIMVLFSREGPFAEGKILAHAGFQEKTLGITSQGTIYLHFQTLLLALDSPELENGLRNLLKHENNDLIQKEHRFRPASEDLSSIHRLWWALQRKIQQAGFISTELFHKFRQIERPDIELDQAA